MPYFLKILASPDNKRDGEKFPLANGETIVGRKAPPAKIELNGTKVSKQHCTFIVTGNALKVEDLKSANGLFVNGARTSSTMLKMKDRLVIGEFVLEVMVG